VLYLAALLVFGFYASNYQAPNAGSCPSNSVSSGPPLPSDVQPATLELAEGERTTLQFGRSQDLRRRTVSFKLSGEPAALRTLPETAALRTRVSAFLRDDDQPLATGSSTEPLVSAVTSRERGLVLLTLCVDRDGRPEELGPPGSYAGTVSIDDARVNPIDIPFTVTMSFPTWPYIFVLFAFIIPVAAAYSWLLKGVNLTTDQALRPAAFLGWLLSRIGVLAVGSGTVAAFIAYSATYLQSATWGANIFQITAIFGAMFTAFVTAATAIMAGSQQPEGPDAQANMPPKDGPSGGPETKPSSAVGGGDNPEKSDTRTP
jgi:hypothetical protein